MALDRSDTLDLSDALDRNDALGCIPESSSNFLGGHPYRDGVQKVTDGSGESVKWIRAPAVQA